MMSMRRYNFLRIFALLFALLMVVWLAVVAAVYRRAAWQSDMLPSPERLAAIVVMTEQTPPQIRPLIINAMKSDVFSIRVQPGDVVADRFDDLPPQSKYDVAGYDSALQGRRFSIENSTGERLGLRVLLPRLMPITLEFKVALSTGETLVVDASSPTLLTAAGLPVGLFAGFAGSLVGLLTLLLVMRASRPLRELADAVSTLDIEGPPRQFPDYAVFSPEIKRIQVAYNGLHRRLSLLLRNRMELIGGISHDLRTFATRLRLKVEAIDDEGVRESAVRDIEDMVRLLDDSLMTSRAGAGELDQEMVSLADLVGVDCKALAQAGKPVDFDDQSGGDPLTVLGDRVALRRIANNIIDNALKYGKRAAVTVRRDGEFAELQVDDAGPGVPPEDRAALFEPFHRQEASRNRSTGGAGLGLAIVKTLVEAHSGVVTLETAPSGGLRAIVRLPYFEA